MKAHLTLLGAVLLVAACTPSAHSSSPASRSPAASPSAAAPAASPTTSGAGQPVVAPGGEPTTGPCAYRPEDIPDKVMVRDLFRTVSQVLEVCVDHRAEHAYFEYLPDPCGRGLGVKTSSIAARRAVQVTYDDDNPSSAEFQPSIYRHTVTAYNSSDAASAYMSSVRAAVRECPVRRLPSATWKYEIVTSTAQRLDLSVRRVADQPAEAGPEAATFRVSLFRSGARVSVVADVGWEGYPSTKSSVDALVKAAAEQLDRWE